MDPFKKLRTTLISCVIGLVMLATTSWAIGGAIGGGGSGSSNASTLDSIDSLGFCQLAGGGLCNATGTFNFDNTDGTADIASASGDQLELRSVGSKSVVIATGNGLVDIAEANGTARMSMIVTPSSNLIGGLGMSQSGGIGWVEFTTNGAGVGARGNRTAAQMVASVSDTIVGSGTHVDLWGVWGSGIAGNILPQAVACAAGVLALDPVSSVVNIDANGAACAVTLAETTAASIGPGFQVTINIVTSAGAGAVTFPDVSGIHQGPVACTTTGIAINDTYTIMYANKSDDMYVGVSCTDNAGGA